MKYSIVKKDTPPKKTKTKTKQNISQNIRYDDENIMFSLCNCSLKYLIFSFVVVFCT